MILKPSSDEEQDLQNKIKKEKARELYEERQEFLDEDDSEDTFVDDQAYIDDVEEKEEDFKIWKGL